MEPQAAGHAVDILGRPPPLPFVSSGVFPGVLTG